MVIISYIKLSQLKYFIENIMYFIKMIEKKLEVVFFLYYKTKIILMIIIFLAVKILIMLYPKL